MSSHQQIFISRFLLTVFVIFLYASVVVAILRSLFTTRKRKGRHYVHFICSDCYKGIEKRLSERIPVDISGRLLINGEPYTVKIVDVSRSGLKCRLNEVDESILHGGESVSIEIPETGSMPSFSEKGRIVWKKNERGLTLCGIEATEKESILGDFYSRMRQQPA